MASMTTPAMASRPMVNVPDEFRAHRGEAKPAATGSESGTVLSSVPDTQDRHQVYARDAVDDKVGRYDHKFPRSGLSSRSAAAGEHRQTVTGEQ
jgi:hypothetical protein